MYTYIHMLIYELNRKADIVIETPVGMTENITVTEIINRALCMDQSCLVLPLKRLTA